MTRPGDWFQTFTGRQIWPHDPRPGDFCIEDIAHGLALSCRFGGHSRRFYSIAEHSVWVSRECSPEHALEGLMHDAAEAYLGDVVAPLKRYLEDFRRIEHEFEQALAQRFGLLYPWPVTIRQTDLEVLMAERRDLMVLTIPWNIPVVPMAQPVECWTPETAERRFLQRFIELTNKLNQE